MFLRIAAATVFASLGLPAAALCVGDNYLDQLSDEQRRDLDEMVADIPYSSGLVWEAQKGADHLTVVGTMHLYDPRLEPILDRVDENVSAADIILVEASPEDQAALQQTMTSDPSMLFITEGPTLPELLEEDTWMMLADAGADRNIPAIVLAKMQPWYVSIVLSMPPCAMEDAIAGRVGLDHMIMATASESNVPVLSLEDPMQLFDIFRDEPLEEQLDVLRMGLMEPDLQQQMFVAMLDRYFAEDIGTLWEMTRLAMDDVPALSTEEATALFNDTQAALLDERNANWMPVITKATEEHDDIIVAVGAAHLIGENGILNLLANDGWTLTAKD